MKFITENSQKTQKLGEMLAQEIKSTCPPKRQARTICLSGELGSGKTTFTQGFLKGLKIKGPYTSPTFVIMKKYNNVYHIDAYRVTGKDILALGWKEIIADKNNLVIIEWAERIKKIIPRDSLWIKFKWLNKNQRELAFSKLLPKLK
jgi:tRNA threonylcarbamoyladenosine biosynthesis protein TsaE